MSDSEEPFATSTRRTFNAVLGGAALAVIPGCGPLADAPLDSGVDAGVDGFVDAQTEDIVDPPIEPMVVAQPSHFPSALINRPLSETTRRRDGNVFTETIVLPDGGTSTLWVGVLETSLQVVRTPGGDGVFLKDTFLGTRELSGDAFLSGRGNHQVRRELGDTVLSQALLLLS